MNRKKNQNNPGTQTVFDKKSRSSLQKRKYYTGNNTREDTKDHIDLQSKR